MDDREKLGTAFMMNRENLVRVIDNQIQGLQMLRTVLDKRDEEQLNELLSTIKDAHEDWWNERSRAEWNHGESRPDIPSMGDHLMHWIGINPKKKKKED